jgi:copper oxidase (laccase) domain-containing protein
MIASDQPTIFSGKIIAAVSSLNDGNMRFGNGSDAETLKNRIAFLNKVHIQPEQTTLVRISYENAKHFARYHVITDNQKNEGMLSAQPSEMIADALVVTRSGHALFLPLADCAGLILYDAMQHILMVSHVGRHSAEIEGAKKSVAYLIEHFSTNPKDIQAWISPAVGKATYPLRNMGGKGLHEVIVEQLHEVGVVHKNIEISGIDTAEHDGYFSHSQFLEGKRDGDGRFAVVAMMNEQGEPAL